MAALILIGVYVLSGMTTTILMAKYGALEDRGKISLMDALIVLVAGIIWPISAIMVVIVNWDDVSKRLDSITLYKTKKLKLKDTLFEKDKNGNS